MLPAPDPRELVLTLARFLGIGPGVAALLAEAQDPPREDFGKLLREARVRQGLSLAEVTERAGITKSNLRFYETGQARPRPGIRTLQALSYGYKIPFARLLVSAIYTFDLLPNHFSAPGAPEEEE